MSDVVLTVEVREPKGKGGARAVRREGKIPGVIYGGDKAPVHIAFQRNEVVKTLNTGKMMAQMIGVDADGSRENTIARAVQFDPVTDEPLHIDLYRVSARTRIDVEVPVRFLNEEESPGLKGGGVLNIVRHTVSVNVPAGSIPEALEIDLTGLDVGDSIHISAVALPKGAEPTIDDRDFTIATIAAPQAEIVEDEVEAAADEVPTVDEAESAEGEGEAEGADSDAE